MVGTLGFVVVVTVGDITPKNAQEPRAGEGAGLLANEQGRPPLAIYVQRHIRAGSRRLA